MYGNCSYKAGLLFLAPLHRIIDIFWVFIFWSFNPLHHDKLEGNGGVQITECFWCVLFGAFASDICSSNASLNVLICLNGCCDVGSASECCCSSVGLQRDYWRRHLQRDATDWNVNLLSTSASNDRQPCCLGLSACLYIKRLQFWDWILNQGIRDSEICNPGIPRSCFGD